MMITAACRMGDIQTAEAAIAKGKTDFVTVGRAFICGSRMAYESSTWRGKSYLQMCELWKLWKSRKI